MNTTRNIMRKLLSVALIATPFLCNSCTTLGTAAIGAATKGSKNSVAESVLGSIGRTNTISNVISSVIGTEKLSHSQIVGMWKYSGPGCAFTSEKTLAKAGGEVMAAKIKDKMAPSYKSIGFTDTNTYVTLNADSTYSAKIAGKEMKGTYLFSEADGKLELKGLLLTTTCYLKRNGNNGLALLFESKKLLSTLQLLAAISGNESLEAIGEISKNYSGVRLGFDMVK